eukprot:6050305-Heterocapsa_arctica.AAC.1
MQIGRGHPLSLVARTGPQAGLEQGDIHPRRPYLGGGPLQAADGWFRIDVPARRVPRRDVGNLGPSGQRHGR